jgi:hypothetical protein
MISQHREHRPCTGKAATASALGEYLEGAKAKVFLCACGFFFAPVLPFDEDTFVFCCGGIKSGISFVSCQMRSIFLD